MNGNADALSVCRTALSTGRKAKSPAPTPGDPNNIVEDDLKAAGQRDHQERWREGGQGERGASAVASPRCSFHGPRTRPSVIAGWFSASFRRRLAMVHPFA